MFNRLFGKPKQENSVVETLSQLNETLELLEKKEKVLIKKVAVEVEKAKKFVQAENKRAAVQCLKRKMLYRKQMDEIGIYQLRLHDQMVMLESAKATTETVGALRAGAAALKAMQKDVKIDNVDKVLDEINDGTDNMKQIQEALSAPFANDFDMDELDAELEELESEELENTLLQPTTTAPVAPVLIPAGSKPTYPVAAAATATAAATAAATATAAAAKKPTSEEDELASLQAEMAL